MKSLKETILLFAGVALLIMWSDQFFYKKVGFTSSYPFLMFGVALFLTGLYQRGLRIKKEQKKKK